MATIVNSQVPSGALVTFVSVIKTMTQSDLWESLFLTDGSRGTRAHRGKKAWQSLQWEPET